MNGGNSLFVACFADVGCSSQTADSFRLLLQLSWLTYSFMDRVVCRDYLWATNRLVALLPPLPDYAVFSLDGRAG